MSDSPDSVWTVLSSCSVCGKALDKDSSPQLLPCCHSSCKECIDDNKNLLTDLVNTNSTDKPEFKCKVCSEVYSPEECIDNYFQLIHWSRNKSKGTQVCQSCDGKNKLAVIQCKTCDWICDDCQILHKTIKVFKGHELDETTKISGSEDSTKVLCPLHYEELTVYCKTCRSPYCCRCILKDHNLHVYEDTKDGNQLNSFYNNLTQKVDSIKEKRSFAENTLQKFETIETDISGQKEQCIGKIKTIVNKLQEKVSELGTTLLDRINTVCTQKEQEFNQKKNQLRQMNAAFKYIEEFVSAILELNEPMDVMKAQDLLNAQLQKLLNKPCSHPDFITPFKIEVIDSLSDGQRNGQKFDVGRMIDGIFDMCFKIETSDDRKEEMIDSNQVTDDEISIIGVTKSNTPHIRPNVQMAQTSNQTARVTAKAQTYRQAAPAISTGLSSVLPTIIRGNSSRELSRMLTNNIHQNNNHTNQMQSYPRFRPNILSAPQSVQSVQSQRFQNAPHTQAVATPSANSMQTSQSLAQMHNNFMPQTGLLLTNQSYGCPQVYRGPVTNQSVQNRSVANVAVPTSLFNSLYNINTQTMAPNVTIRPNQQIRHSIGVSTGHNGQHFLTFSHSPPTYGSPTTTQTTVQSVGTTQPTVVCPAVSSGSGSPQTQNITIISQLTNAANSILNQQSAQTSQQQQHHHPHPHQQQQPFKNRYELEKQKEIERIEQDLRDTSPPFSCDPLAKRVKEILRNENITEYQNSISDFQTPNASNTNTSASCGQSLPTSNRTYELHIPEDIITEPVRRVSEATNPSPPVTTQTIIQNTNSSVQTVSVNSSEQTTAFSMPILSDVTIESTAEKSSESNKEKTCEQNGNTVRATPSPPTPSEETEEIILPNIMSPQSVNSLFSELSDDPFPETNITETNISDNNREENRENASSSGRLAAPIARIVPITNETESSNNERQEVVEISDDITDDEAIDEDADCVVCSKEYGEFICCSQCPRAFHCECHVPELKKMPETSFICTFCKTLDGVFASSRGRKSGLNDRQQRICEKVLLHLLCNKKSLDFKPPVSDSIQQTISLNTIKKKLENKEFENEILFIDDIKRLFSRYKNRDITPEVMDEYNTFERYFKKIVHKLMPSFSEALQNNTSINNFDSSSGSAPKKTKSNCIPV